MAGRFREWTIRYQGDTASGDLRHSAGMEANRCILMGDDDVAKVFKADRDTMNRDL